MLDGRVSMLDGRLRARFSLFSLDFSLYNKNQCASHCPSVYPEPTPGGCIALTAGIGAQRASTSGPPSIRRRLSQATSTRPTPTSMAAPNTWNS